MIKAEELTNPNSCMSRAKDDEMTFVLLARDITAPGTIRDWCQRRMNCGKNTWDDPQIQEGTRVRRENGTATSGGTVSQVATKRERVPTFITVYWPRGRKRFRNVPVEGRPTKVPGLLITPEFMGWWGKGSKYPIINKRKYRLGTVDGYAAGHTDRLKDALALVDKCAALKMDFRPPRQKLKKVLEENRNHPTVKEHFTLYVL